MLHLQWNISHWYSAGFAPRPVLCLRVSNQPILGTGGYLCRPIDLAQTRTFSTARKSLGPAAAIMLWLTGSPPVLMTQTNASSIPMCFICLLLLPFIPRAPFVPLHVPVLTGDVYEQLPTIKVVKLAPFAWECFFNCVCASIQAWEGFCHKMTSWGSQMWRSRRGNFENSKVTVLVCS